MSNNSAIVTFTARSAERIVREGGTAAWRLDRQNARRCTYAVCVRNAHTDWGDGAEEHGTAFLVGRVSGVAPTKLTRDGKEPLRPRYLIAFSAYAYVNIPDSWPKGYRNPVLYSTLDELGIDPSSLKWITMPEPTEDPTDEEDSSEDFGGNGEPLTIAEAKQGLAITFGVSPDAVEIVIRG